MVGVMENRAGVCATVSRMVHSKVVCSSRSCRTTHFSPIASHHKLLHTPTEHRPDPPRRRVPHTRHSDTSTRVTRPPAHAPLLGACQQQHECPSAVARARGGMVEEGRWAGLGCRPPGRARAPHPPHRLLGSAWDAGARASEVAGWRRAALAAVAVPLEAEEELEDAAFEAALEAALVARLPLAVDYLGRGSAERLGLGPGPGSGSGSGSG